MVTVNLDEKLVTVLKNGEAVLSNFLKDVERSIKPLTDLLPLNPLTLPADQTPNECRKANLSKAIRLENKDIDVEYTVLEKKKWLTETRYQATVMLRYGEVFEGFYYLIPTEKNPISQEQVEAGVEILEQFCIVVQLKPESEVSLMRLVTSLTGCRDFEVEFLKRKNRFCQTLYSANIDKLQSTIQSACQKLKDFFHEEKLQEKLNLSIKEEIEKTRTELQKIIEEKTNELESKKLEYENKIKMLDEKLASHREKVNNEFDEAVLRFEEFFTDDSSSTNGYWSSSPNSGLNQHLRTFYLLKLKQDIQDCQYLTVKQALRIIELIRHTCYASNGKPTAADFKEIYAGFRATLDYLRTHDLTAANAIAKMEAAANARKGKKPEVEVFVEQVFTVDFDMGRYRQGLHNVNARSKADLGLK